MHTRRMRESDLEEVVQNEAAAYGQPWSRRVFMDCLQAGYQCWVVADGGRLAAHGVMSVAIGECHLLTLCVHPRYRRRGLARRLFRMLLDRAHKEEARVCFLEVRRSNTAAITLYRSLGFVQVGERKDYYPQAAEARTEARGEAREERRQEQREQGEQRGAARESAVIMSCRLPLSDAASQAPPSAI